MMEHLKVNSTPGFRSQLSNTRSPWSSLCCISAHLATKESHPNISTQSFYKDNLSKRTFVSLRPAPFGSMGMSISILFIYIRAIRKWFVFRSQKITVQFFCKLGCKVSDLWLGKSDIYNRPDPHYKFSASFLLRTDYYIHSFIKLTNKSLILTKHIRIVFPLNLRYEWANPEVARNTKITLLSKIK